MSVLSILLWLRRRSSARRRDSADSRDRRRVRPALELLEARFAPGNLLFADGMALTNLLASQGSTAGGALGDPLPNPFGAASSSPSSGTGLGLSTVPPTTGGSSGPAASTRTAPTAPSTGASAPTSFSAPSSGSSTTLTNTPPAPTSPPPTGPGSPGGSGTTTTSMMGGGGSSMQQGSGGSGSTGSGSSGSGSTMGYVMITGFATSPGQPLSNSYFTNNPKPTFVGTGAPGETLSMQIDGAASGSTTVGANGQWSWTATSALVQGNHTLTATSGGAGFTSQTSSFNFAVDLSPPTVTLKLPDIGTYKPPLLTVAAAATNPSGLNLTVHIDVDLQHDGKFTDPGDTDFGVAQLMPDGTASFYLLTPLKIGTYTMQARAYDNAGNEGFSATAQFYDDPYLGYLGSEPLLDLAYGDPYGTGFALPNDPHTPPIQYPPGQTVSGTPGMPAPDYLGTPQLPPLGGGAGVGPSGFPFLQFDGQNRVLVDIHATLPGDLSGLQGFVTAKDGFSTLAVYPSQEMVQGWLPIGHILDLHNAPNFGYVDPVFKPITHVDQNGDALIMGPQFRASQNVTGAGEKVGIISDSVSEFQGGLADSVAAGALPANVQVIQDLPGGGGTDEGRAMLEIVHQIAPGAALAFATGALSPQNMATNIGALAAAGSNVIADDIGYGNEPFFNNGVIGQAAEAVVPQGIVYASAAGNTGSEGYLAGWTPITTTVAGVNGSFQNIQGGSALQTFTLAAGSNIDLSFEWSSPFLEGGGTGAFMVPNDVEVLITNAAGTTLDATFNSQGTNVNEADQIVQFTNNGSFGSNNFAMAFRLVSGPAPGTIAWVAQEDGADPMALKEGGPTSYGHPTAPGVIDVGATDVSNPTTAEPFSSQGGMPLLFNDAGAPMTPIITGPVVTGPDGVMVSFQLDGQALFFGTSAATPHIAGAAALLLQDSQGAATPAQVTQYLQTNAIALPPGPIVTGSGLIQLLGPISTGGGGGGGGGGSPGSQFADDGFESNDTSDQASQMGGLSGGTDEIAGLTINYHPNGAPDYDWFQWTLTQSGTVTATETTTTPGTPTGNLELHLFTIQGGYLVDLGDSTAPGMTHTVAAALSAGSQVLVEVHGHETNFGVLDQGAYTLDVTLQ